MEPASHSLEGTAWGDHFALLIGAMKSGTTSLFEHLSHHPAISPCREKEPDFFSDDSRWRRGTAWYRGLWSWDPERHRVALEASTSYTMVPRRPCVAGRVASLESDVRLLYLMRDPLERIESEYRHEVGVGRRPPGRPIGSVDPEKVAISDYRRQLEPFYRRFPAERILLLVFEELKEAPGRVLDTVVAFLDLPPWPGPPGPGRAYNPARSYHPLYHWLVRVPGLPRLARSLPEASRAAFRRLLRREPDPDLRLGPEQRRAVMGEIGPGLRRLAGERGLDLSRWPAMDEL